VALLRKETCILRQYDTMNVYMYIMYVSVHISNIWNVADFKHSWRIAVQVPRWDGTCVFIHKYEYVHIHMYIYTHGHIYIHTYTCTHIWTYTYIWMNACIWIYMYTFTYILFSEIGICKLNCAQHTYKFLTEIHTRKYV